MRAYQAYLIFFAIAVSFNVFVVILPWLGDHRTIDPTLLLLVNVLAVGGLGISMVLMGREITHKPGTRVRGGWMEPDPRTPDPSTGRMDLGDDVVTVTGSHLVVRFKVSNSTSELPREDLKVRLKRRRRPPYYLAPPALYVFACYYAAMFLSRSLQHESELLIVYAIFALPFLLRVMILVTRRFTGKPATERWSEGMVALVFMSAIIWFVSSYGSVETNPYNQQALLSFFLLGGLPYVALRAIGPMWEEAEIAIESGGEALVLSSSARQAERLALLLTHNSRS